MKKIYLSVVLLLGLFFGLSLTKMVKAELLPVVGNPYAYDLDLEFVKTASGEAHTIALGTDGKLYAWGWNMEGQLGNGTTNGTLTPIEITSFLNLNPSEKVIDIAAGALMSSCITSSGRVLMWGQNNYGQLGDDTTISKLWPIDITANFYLEVGEEIVFMELGQYSSSAISSLGRVFAWGYNSFGQLGDGSTYNQSIPLDITANFNLEIDEAIVATAFDYYHSAAISSLGRVFTWGANNSGCIGDGTYVSTSLPNDITSFFSLNPEETVTDVRTGQWFSGALTSEGRVFMWGYNIMGQLGDGTTFIRTVPTDITANFTLDLGETITDLSLGIGHSGVITSQKRVFVWGDNNYFQLGDGTGSFRTLPVNITNIVVLNEDEKYQSISFGGYFSSMLTNQNKLLSCGNNNVGQLGDGTTSLKPIPTRLKAARYTVGINYLPVSETIVKQAFTDSFSAVITASNRLYMFGNNQFGQLGTGTTINSMPVDITDNFNLGEGEVIVDIYLASYSSLAITSEGRIFTWGYNYYGQLADGTTSNKYLPIDVTANFGIYEPETIKEVSIGSLHGFILTSDSRVIAWGCNVYGQLGNGTTESKYSPIDVTSYIPLNVGESVESIATGGFHTVIYTSENRVFTWGKNDEGQLGDLSWTQKTLPTEITSLLGMLPEETIADIDSMYLNSSLVTSTGRILNWGHNGFGQISDGTTTNRNYPVEVTGQFSLDAGEKLVSVEVGHQNISAFSSSGRLFIWGNNQYGQIGDGTTNIRPLPYDVTPQIDLLVGETITKLDLGGSHFSALTDYGRLFVWGNNSDYQLGFPSANVLSPYELNKLIDYNNELIFTYIDRDQNHLLDEYKLTILPKFEIRDEIQSIKINGVEYYDFTNIDGRIDVYLPNNWGVMGEFPLTVETITFTNLEVMNLTGNTETLLVLVEDTYAPVISFAYENELYIEEGIGSFDYIAATALDDTSEVITVIITETIDWYLPGEYLVTYSARDLSGNTSTRQRTVFIMDDISVDGTVYYEMTFYYFEPDIYVPGSPPTGQIVRYNEVNYYSSTDNSGFAFMSGWNEVPYEFIINDRLVVASVPVYSDDFTPPTMDPTPDQYIEAGEYEDFDWTTVVTGVMDNSLTPVTLTEVADNVTYDMVNGYFVIVRATDTSGNYTEQAFAVYVNDFTAPELNVTELTYEAGSLYDFNYSLYATDNAVGDLYYIETYNNVNMNIPGIYTVEYFLEDGSGNYLESSFLVNVVDTTAPSFTIPDQSITVGIYDSLWPFLENVSDNSDQPLLYLEVDGFIDYNQKGVYTVTVRLSDGYGNYHDEDVTITLVDDLAPTFDVQDQTIEVGVYTFIDWALYVENIYDNYDLDCEIIVISDPMTDYGVLGAYLVKIRVTDDDGNYTEKPFIVSVVDTQKPVISLSGPSDIYLDYQQTYVEPGAFCLDNYDSCSVIITGMVDTTALGTYHLYYDATDSSGNVADTVTRTIFVVDRIAPEIFIIGSTWIFLEVGSTYIDPGAYVIDNYGMNSQVNITGAINTSVVGTYYIYYDAIDMFGNIALSINRMVSIIDTTPPEFSISNQVIEVGKYTWIDWVQYIEDIKDNYSVVFELAVKSDGVDYGTVGVYPATVTVTDQDGNVAEEEFYVSVVDLTPPDFTVHNHTIEAGSFIDIDWTLFIEGEVDNYSTIFTYQEVLDFVNYQMSGVYLVKVKLIDEAGNYLEKTMDITVIDTTPPDFIINNQTIEAGDYLDIDWTGYIASASDNSAGELIFREDLDEVDYNTPGVYIATVTVTDQDGNETTKTIDVTVIDTTPPEFNITIEAGLENIDWTTFITDMTDNSDGELLAYEVEDNINYNLPGLYLVVVGVVDESDNESLRILNVTVRDTVAPTVTLNPSLDTLKQGSDYFEYGVTVDEVTDFEVLVSGEVDTEVPGVYELIYQVTDSSGNRTLIKRYVTVYAEEPLVTFVLGNALTTVKIGDEYIDGTCSVYINGSPFSCTVKSSNVNTNVKGIYTIIYSYIYLDKEYTYKRYVFVYDLTGDLEIYYLPIWKRDEEL